MPLAYKCRGCGGIEPQKWTFRCPNCGGFFNITQCNSDIGEEAQPIDGEVISLQDAITHAIDIPRIETDMPGVDYVLGGGFSQNGAYLLCGDPGVGKTTVLIQIFQSLARLRYDVLFVSGEQTVNDIAIRAKNYGKFSARMAAVRETNLDRILDIITERKPAVVAIDSLQTLMVTSDDQRDLDVGSATSIKTAARIITQFAKEAGVCIILVGHVTKDGGISGPRALEHYVDVSLYFSGNKQNPIRYLKCESKNRWGSTPRQSRFKMTESGLIEYPEENYTDESDFMATQTDKAVPALEAVPLDIDNHFPNQNLASFWTAPDGTPATTVLAVACPTADCRGKIDRACTAADGTLESGFHEARVAKSKLKPAEQPEVVFDSAQEETLESDPFEAKPLTAKPKVKKSRSRRMSDA